MVLKKVFCIGLLSLFLAEAKSVTSISSATQLCRETIQPNKNKMLFVSRKPYDVKETSREYVFSLNATNPEGIWICTVNKSDGKVKVSDKY